MPAVSTRRPDITLILSGGGIIQEAICGGSLAEECVDDWVGKHWASTVAEGGSRKVQRLIETARVERFGGFSQITQRLPSGRELLLEFSAVRSDTDRLGIVAVGKNLGLVVEQQQKLLAAQRSIEREYWKRRDVESRYRAMIESTSEAVVLIRDSDLNVIEANSRARRLLRLSREDEPGTSLDVGTDTPRIKNILRETRRSGQAPSTIVRLGSRGERWRVNATAVHGMQELHFLLQFSSIDRSALTAHSDWCHSQEGFVLIDANGLVQMTNETFVELAGAAGAAEIVGRSIGTWLENPRIDEFFAAAGHPLMAQLRVSAARTVPVRVSTWELEAAEEGGLALLIETLAPVSPFH